MPDASETRRSVYLLLTAVAVAVAAARVLAAENLLEPSRYTPPADGYSANPPDPPRKWPATRPDPTPMLSSNDKSRFATIRALVDEKTYSIGKRVYPDGQNPKVFTDEGIIAEPQYKSLDIVLRPLGPDASGPQSREFYSSKPPLMPMLLAGEYWLLKNLFGWDITRDRFVVIPFIVFTVNVLPFAVYLVLLARLIEATGKTDFGRLLAFTAGAVGTFLITFSTTLNNHSPAVFCVLFAVYPLVRAMQEKRDMSPAGYLCCGFFASFAATFDLPAAALLAALGIPLFIARTRNTMLFFLPGVLVPLIALLACNYAAMGQLLPAYSEFGGLWYNFEGSHWAKRGTPLGKGLDFNEEPMSVYAFHLLFGHHGWFSLTPVWFLAFGTIVGLGIRSAVDVRKMFAKPAGTGWTPEVFAAMTFVVSLTVFAFYLSRTQSYNYGGNTSGPRWLFWLIPLWLLAIPLAADRLASSRGGRFLCAVLLGFSVLAVFYPAANPWRNPWILSLLEYTGIKRY
ncbi:MAG: hypothetical protein C0467_03645 [Planctomycetaceae bacterium]|nr:hypothetical protein [Planctomycetaceae bacterium]